MEEMGDSKITAQFLVDHDTARERVGRRCNHENDGAPVAKDRVCRVERLFERSQQDARDSGLVEQLEIVVLLGSSAVAVGEKELQLSMPCCRLSTARDVDEERVPDIDKDQADSICPSCRERSGRAIAYEAQFRNRRFDFEARVFSNEIGIVEDVRDRANRYAGAPRDVLNPGIVGAGGVAIVGTYPNPRL
jgi:hypothetical protein